MAKPVKFKKYGHQIRVSTDHKRKVVRWIEEDRTNERLLMAKILDDYEQRRIAKTN